MESVFNEFPKYYRNSMLRVSEKGHIGIITFWSKKEEIMKLINPLLLNDILTIGNLYTKEGIKYIVMNSIFTNMLCDFILIGNDKNEVAQYFGKYNNFNIEAKDKFTGEIIDYEKMFINRYTNHIHHATEYNINALIEQINSKKYHLFVFPENNYFSKFELIEPKKEALLSYESEETAFLVRDSNLERLWKRILTKINLFGYVKESDNDLEQKELIAVVSVLTNKAEVFDDMPNKEILDSYIPQVVSKDVSEGLAYTYGSRLHEYEQIENIVSELSKNPFSRRAISLTYRPEIDSTSKYPPCLILTDFKIQRNKLYLTCYFRSHDAYNAYCMNVYALQLLQMDIINKINKNLELGNITIVSNSCHVYKRDFDKIINFKELDCNLDKRGYFVITTDNENNLIHLQHLTNDNNIQFECSSDNVKELLDKSQPFISEISHALYLGKELQRAKHCLEDKTKYVQD